MRLLIPATLLCAALCAGCPRPVQPGWRQPRTPELMLRALRGALWRRDLTAISLLLSHRCRLHCAGFVPRVIDTAGGSQVARWLALPPGAVSTASSELERASRTLIGALGVAFLSYRELDWVDLVPLRVRRYEGRVLVRARLTAQGVDLTGARRSDDGLLDLELVERSGLWRFARVDVARVYTVRRPGAGFDAPGPQRRPEPAAREVKLGARVALRPSPRASDGTWVYGARGATVWRFRVSGEGGDARRGAQNVLKLARGRVRDLLLLDVDGDGHDELFVGASESQSGLFALAGSSAARRVSAPVDGDVVRALAADFDGDGRVDLFLARRHGRDLLLRGRPPARRGVRRVRFAIGELSDTRAVDACAGDVDGDGAADIIVIDARGGARLVARRRGRFVVRTVGGAPRFGLSCSAGDLDGDGRDDIVIGALGQQADVSARGGGRDPALPLFGGARSRRRAARARAGSVVLMSRPGGRDGRVRFERRALGARQWWSWVALADQDNDGDLDLLVRIAQPSQAARAALWRGVFGPRVRGVNPFASKVSSATLDDRRDALWLNAWRGELVDAAGATALGWRAERGAALLFDIDGDGDLDLVRGEHVTRWRGGEGGLDDASAQHALLLELRSRSRANRQGLGARVELVIEGRKQVRFAGLAPGMAGAAPGRVHFGVGSELRGEKVTVWWPGGEREVYPDLPVDRLVRLVQGGGALWGDRLRAREPAPSSRPVTPPATRPAPPASRPSATRARAEVLSLLPGALRRRFAAALRKKGAGLVLLAPAACAPCVGHCRSITKLAAATKTASLSLGRAITRCTLPHAAASRSALRELAPLLPAILVVDATGKVRTTSVDFDATRLRSDIARLRR